MSKSRQRQERDSVIQDQMHSLGLSEPEVPEVEITELEKLQEPVPEVQVQQAPVEPGKIVIRYECYEHPEQRTEFVHLEGQRLTVPICPCCGYQMIKVIDPKPFVRK